MLRAPQKRTIKLFLTREARYDFDFSLETASENDHNAPKARYDCAPCYCKMLRTVLFCVSRYGTVRIFHHQCSSDRTIAVSYWRPIQKSNIFGKAPKFRFWGTKWAPVQRGQDNSIFMIRCLLGNRPFSARLPHSYFGTPNGHQCSGDKKIPFPY